MSEYLIYDSDSSGWQGANQKFSVTDGAPVQLKSAGLTETVQVYQAVGDCYNCVVDILWEPLTICGEPIELGPDNNMVWVKQPGKYSLGDPNDPPEFSGDVNITASRVKGASPHLLEDCGPTEENPLPVEVISSCEEPLLVEVCNQTPVETAMSQLGCITDEQTGEQIGVVMYCKMVDETTGVVTYSKIAEFEDGTQILDYTGAWSVCADDVCVTAPFMGVLTDLTLLSN